MLCRQNEPNSPLKYRCVCSYIHLKLNLKSSANFWNNNKILCKVILTTFATRLSTEVTLTIFTMRLSMRKSAKVTRDWPYTVGVLNASAKYNYMGCIWQLKKLTRYQRELLHLKKLKKTTFGHSIRSTSNQYQSHYRLTNTNRTPTKTSSKTLTKN